MNQPTHLLGHFWFALAMTVISAAHANNPTVAINNKDNKSAPIPMDQLGAVAGKQYQGDGLSVSATPDGARLRCAFQRLEGQVTREGLRLSSTADSSSGERFRVTAMEVGRVTPCAPLDDFGFDDIFRSVAVPGHSAATIADTHEQSTPLLLSTLLRPGTGALRDTMWRAELRFGSFLSPIPNGPIQRSALPPTGIVNVADNVARFIRPGLTEEYSVSVDGVRQDFIIEQRPAGEGELRVELDVTGAKAEPLVNGARLVLDGSERKLAYNRLRVVDATGRELPARMEIASGILPDAEGAHPAARNLAANNSKANLQARPESAGLEAPALRQAWMPAATKLAVLVDDADAIYPVRIDPTFSDADWISMGGLPGANGLVFAAVTDDFGNLYIGGYFTFAGDVSANRIAKWNGTSWSALGSGMNDSVYSLAVSGTDLYAGGEFTTAGDNTANQIAKWNGTAWSAFGSGMNGRVSALAVSGTNLYAGGVFTTAGGNAATNIAKWDGSLWSTLGSGISGDVTALAVSGTNLYAGGGFGVAGGNSAIAIAKWNGNSWSALGSGMNDYVEDLSVSGTNLYVGGSFTTAGGILANYIAKWDGNTWSTLGSGMNAHVTALAMTGTNLYAGGSFGAAGGTATMCVARWNGSTWSALGTGMNGSFYALTLSGTNLYAGGDFTTAGGTIANRIAKWDGNSWWALGTGMNSTVRTLAVSGTNLFAGGFFTMAGGVAANYIAKWDGITWSALGSGVNSLVFALTVSGTNLYAGGQFTTAGGTAASRIAKWDGNAWSALGLGVSGGVVAALAVSSTNLYAGGWFSTAGGNTANQIARWDGSTWSALGSGMAGGAEGTSVRSILPVSSTDIYVGGAFSTAGGNAARNLAKWDGVTWSALGSGADDIIVNALAVSGTDLYAGGDSVVVGGGTVANRIAKWDGNAWLSSRMDNSVNALVMSGTNLYAGGTFVFAGNKVSAYITKANIGAAPGRFTNLVYSPVNGFGCTFQDASVGQPYRIQTSPSLAAGDWTDFTNITYTAPIVITDASALSGTNKFFRAITP